MVAKYLELGLEHARILDAPVVVPCGGNLVYYDDVASVMNQAVYTPYDFADFAKVHAPDIASRVFPLVAGDCIFKRNGRDEISWQPSSVGVYQAALANFLSDWAARNPTKWTEPRALGTDDLAFLERRLKNDEIQSQNYNLIFCRSDDVSVGFRVNMNSKTIHMDTQSEDGKPWIRFEVHPVAFDAWLCEEIIFEVILESARFLVFRDPEVHDPKIWEALRNYF